MRKNIWFYTKIFTHNLLPAIIFNHIINSRGYYVTDDNYIKYGYEIKNSSKKTTYQFPTVTITAYDENGHVLATEDQVMGVISPGEKQAFGSVADCNGKSPDKVEFTVDSGQKIFSTNEVPSSSFKITGTNERNDEFGETSITGNVKNDSKKDLSDLQVTVLYKKDGKIVCGSSTYVDNLSAGQQKAFEVSDYDIPDHDKYEVTALDWSMD